jgi:hypothetical protein
VSLLDQVIGGINDLRPSSAKQRDSCAFVGESGRDRLAQVLARAGDHSDTTGQPTSGQARSAPFLGDGH